jgi:hypothetical protein
MKNVGIAVLLLLGAIQFVRPARTNPLSDPAASFGAAAKPSPEVAAILERSCKDCHSHNTVWPWYSRIAPVSWLVASDIKDGRRHLNLSEWSLYSPEKARTRIKEMCSEVKGGDMPLWIYTLVHRSAKLSPEDVTAICAAAGSPTGTADGRR